MESPRLILVPQLPVRMRYQEWWPQALEENITGFDSIITLGARHPEEAPIGGISPVYDAIQNELEQMEQFMGMNLFSGDVLFHCDLSFPGLFHSVLFHKRPFRTVVFCHATSLNRYDYFHSQRTPKWRVERSHTDLYDEILVASNYHLQKLDCHSVIAKSLGALPNPPDGILPPSRAVERGVLLCSTARPTVQKVDKALERLVEKAVETKIRRYKFLRWCDYFRLLDRAQFLLITSKEETYGYQVIDALLRGCKPIAPRAYSYPEILPDHLLYNPTLPPEEKAKEIATIIRNNRSNLCPKPKNQKAIDQFYKNLSEELLK